MKAERKGPFHFILIFIMAFAVIRFFPLIIQVIQALAIGLRGLWWLVLPSVVVGWVIWKSKRRVLIKKNSEDSFHTESLRDVTNSAVNSNIKD